MQPSPFCIRSRQLENIRQSVQRVLAALEFYSASQPTLIECKHSGDSAISVKVEDHELIFSPLIPGSLLHLDVKVSIKPLNGRNKLITALQWRAYSRQRATPPSGTMDSQYTSHDQLALPVARQYYRHRFARILWISHAHPERQILGIKRLNELWTTLYASFATQRPEVFYYPSCNINGNEVTKVTEHSSVVKAIKKEERCHTLDLDARLNRISLISKSDYIFSDDVGVAADTIALSKPFSFCVTPKSPCTGIQLAFDQYLKHRDRSQLIDEQQDSLAEQLSLVQQNTIVINTEKSLRQLLNLLKSSTQQIDSDSPTHENSTLFDNDLQLILSEQHTELSNPNNSNSLQQRLVSGRRKWRKFRESPQRFVHDSQHWSLKTVKSVIR